MPKISELKQQEDGKTFGCDKREKRDITWEFGRDLNLTMCSGLLQKVLLEGGEVLWRKFVFNRN